MKSLCVPVFSFLFLLKGIYSCQKDQGTTEVEGVGKCIIIAPDDYSGSISDKYNPESWRFAESQGLVCLSPNGLRDGTGMAERDGFNGGYWSGTMTTQREGFEVITAPPRKRSRRISEKTVLMKVNHLLVLYEKPFGDHHSMRPSRAHWPKGRHSKQEPFGQLSGRTYSSDTLAQSK